MSNDGYFPFNSMPKIRVLIVDDAVVVRSRLSKLLAADPEIEVVGVAATGRIALAKLSQVYPDVVILDVEMPDLNGLETLTALRQTHPQLPVIMFSALTYAGATATLDALTLGASDYATKPSNLGNVEAANRHIQSTLIPKIKALSAKATTTPPKASAIANPPRQKTIIAPSNLAKINLIAIGVSTGGPNALMVLLSQLPPKFPVPIAIVQHMPPMFTKLLAERLDAKCSLQVQEARPGVRMTAGTVWIAPGGYHLKIERDATDLILAINQDPPENSCRPSVDVLFRSVAQATKGYGNSIAVILTGMGQDGFQGCQQIRQVGGQILAQDEASSVVWGMPGYVVNAGLADVVLPLDAIAGELLRRVGWTAPFNSLDSTKT
jgi:two-component system, chemotaxis family, protein-glutamate methylesterase/glutaminase